MSISVTIIAHNEAEWIGRCITSLLQQTLPPDEIIILAHNCTDETVLIAKRYPVKIIECNEQGGISTARMRAIENTTGEIICCTDGDCWVDTNWVKRLTKPLQTPSDVSIVGGYTKIQNNLFWKFSCWWQFVIQRKILNKKSHRFVWGSNFAFRKKDYGNTEGLSPFFALKKELGLHYDADDLYLSLVLQKVGNIFFTTDAFVYTYMPREKASIRSQKEIVKKQQADNKALFSFFKI